MLDGVTEQLNGALDVLYVPVLVLDANILVLGGAVAVEESDLRGCWELLEDRVPTQPTRPTSDPPRESLFLPTHMAQIDPDEPRSLHFVARSIRVPNRCTFTILFRDVENQRGERLTIRGKKKHDRDRSEEGNPQWLWLGRQYLDCSLADPNMPVVVPSPEVAPHAVRFFAVRFFAFSLSAGFPEFPESR